MISIFERIINLFFPPRCVFCGQLCQNDQFVCHNCEAYKTPDCLDYLPNSCNIRFSFDRCTAPYYYDSTVSKAICDFKFHNKSDLARPMGRLIAERVRQVYGSINFDCIVYVPLSQKGLNERKYDQSELLAKYASKALKIPVLYGALTKDNNCKIQHHLNYNERWLNTQNAFWLSGKFDSEILSGKTILLFDDICTTGATLNSCSNVLKVAGARSVYCATVAMSKYIIK